MATRYDILHTTTYRYSEPVSFGLHRVMFRPRDSHDLRVLATDLQVFPPSDIRLIQDPHSNSVALVQPRENAAELKIVCAFTIEHVPGPDDELPLDPSAEFIPFAYSVQDRLDLEHYLRPHHDDPDGVLMRWAQQFLQTEHPNSTREVLTRMNAFIGQNFSYAVRHEEGTQTPLQTLETQAGTCRDYALLMMEAARRLGVATRFVSGYLYDAALDPAADAAAAAAAADGSAPAPDGTQPPHGPATDPATGPTTGPATNLAAAPAAAPAASPALEPAAPAPPADMTGSGFTHAWLHAYLPGAGWVAFDPTNNLMGSAQLIRVGVARDPSQAAPIAGSWFGAPAAYQGMEVSVQVRRVAV